MATILIGANAGCSNLLDMDDLFVKTGTHVVVTWLTRATAVPLTGGTGGTDGLAGRGGNGGDGGGSGMPAKGGGAPMGGGGGAGGAAGTGAQPHPFPVTIPKPHLVNADDLIVKTNDGDSDEKRLRFKFQIVNGGLEAQLST